MTAPLSTKFGTPTWNCWRRVLSSFFSFSVAQLDLSQPQLRYAPLCSAPLTRPPVALQLDRPHQAGRAHCGPHGHRGRAGKLVGEASWSGSWERPPGWGLGRPGAPCSPHQSKGRALVVSPRDDLLMFEYVVICLRKSGTPMANS